MLPARRCLVAVARRTARISTLPQRTAPLVRMHSTKAAPKPEVPPVWMRDHANDDFDVTKCVEALSTTDGKQVVAVKVAPTVCVLPSKTPLDITGLKPLDEITSDKVKKDAHCGVFTLMPLPDDDYILPSTNYKIDPSDRRGERVLLVGISEDGQTHIVPTEICKEHTDDRRLEIADPLPGLTGVLLCNSNHRRFFGIVWQDGTIVSTKDPYFIINWVSHALPALRRLPKDQNKIMRDYINLVKRTIVQNEEVIPSMGMCKPIFVRNSIDAFPHNML